MFLGADTLAADRAIAVLFGLGCVQVAQGPSQALAAARPIRGPEPRRDTIALQPSLIGRRNGLRAAYKQIDSVLYFCE